MNPENAITKSEATTPATAERYWATPPVDVFENEQEILIYADLPGVKKEDVHLSYEEGSVKLEATFGPRTYKRVFETQLTLDADRISAELKHGVLTLRLPKRQRQARAIAVS